MTAFIRGEPDAAAAYNPAVPEADSLERAIAGALRATIRDHGPITAELVSSAVKRIVGNLPNARADGLARALGRRRFAGRSAEEVREHQSAAAKARWKDVPAAERSELQSKAGKAAWKDMTLEERRTEMRRRRRLGLKRKASAGEPDAEDQPVASKGLTSQKR